MAMEKLNPISSPSSVRVALMTTPKSSRPSSGSGSSLDRKSAPTRADTQSTSSDRTKTRRGKFTILAICENVFQQASRTKQQNSTSPLNRILPMKRNHVSNAIVKHELADLPVGPQSSLL